MSDKKETTTELLIQEAKWQMQKFDGLSPSVFNELIACIENVRLENEHLVNELKECCTSLIITADQVEDASKADPRWEGVPKKLRQRIRSTKNVITKVKEEQE